VKSAAQAGDDVLVEVGSGSYTFAYDGASLSARINPPSRFSTRTKIEDLVGEPRARAAIDKRIPGFSTDPRLPQAYQMTLRDVAPYAPDVFTEEMLKNLDADRAAIP
jgi:hypothetical protein